MSGKLVGGAVAVRAAQQGLAKGRASAGVAVPADAPVLSTPRGVVHLEGVAFDQEGRLVDSRVRPHRPVTLVFTRDGDPTSDKVAHMLRTTWPTEPLDTGSGGWEETEYSDDESWQENHDPLIIVPLDSVGPPSPVPGRSLPLGDPRGPVWSAALGFTATPAIVTISCSAGTWWHTSVPRALLTPLPAVVDSSRVVGRVLPSRPPGGGGLVLR